MSDETCQWDWMAYLSAHTIVVECWGASGRAEAIYVKCWCNAVQRYSEGWVWDDRIMIMINTNIEERSITRLVKDIGQSGCLAGKVQVLLGQGQWYHLGHALLWAACTEKRDELQGWSKTLPDQGVVAGEDQVLFSRAQWYWNDQHSLRALAVQVETIEVIW